MLRKADVALGLKIRSDRAHQKLLKLGPGGSSGYNSADQTCTCLLGLGECSQSIPAPLSPHRAFGMSKWKRGASCRAVFSKDEGPGGKTIYCILDITAGDYIGEDLQCCFDEVSAKSGDTRQVICVGPASAYFLQKRTKTNMLRGGGLTINFLVYRESLCSPATLRGAASTVWLFSIGMDNKTWTGRTCSGALMLRRPRQRRSRREGIRRGSIRKGPIGCNLAELIPVDI